MQSIVVLGHLVRHADGGFAGVLGSVIVRTQIDLRPASGGKKTFEVFCDGTFRLGTAWLTDAGRDGGERLTLRLDAPEFPVPILASAFRGAPTHDDDPPWIISWDGRGTPRAAASRRKRTGGSCAGRRRR